METSIHSKLRSAFDFSRLNLAWFVAAALASCGQWQPPLDAAAGGFARAHRPNQLAPSYQLLHSFSGNGGSYPDSRLAFVGGRLYGTTYQGGAYGGGTIFALEPDGKMRIVHSFQRGAGGFGPGAGVTEFNGKLFGTTIHGGKRHDAQHHSDGVVFSISTSGANYRVIHRFLGGQDGAFPSRSPLIVLNGRLYGATEGYSSSTSQCASSEFGCGTVFEITPPRKLRTIYSFGGGRDGYAPMGVVALDGTLYGTTEFGGMHECPYQIGCGTIFSVTLSGAKRRLYSFNGKYGYWPMAGLAVLGGALYGDTSRGGISQACIYYVSRGCGTIFGITTSGNFHVVYRFKRDHDGATPVAALLAVKGTLYGTTQYGPPDGGSPKGEGTVFSITTGGHEVVLHEFEGPPKDGEDPEAALANAGGRLYGTTYGGGASERGTVFSIAP
jgi:uncharacterized repeat protein (TIGR03803 family)